MEIRLLAGLATGCDMSTWLRLHGVPEVSRTPAVDKNPAISLPAAVHCSSTSTGTGQAMSSTLKSAAASSNRLRFVSKVSVSPEHELPSFCQFPEAVCRKRIPARNSAACPRTKSKPIFRPSGPNEKSTESKANAGAPSAFSLLICETSAFPERMTSAAASAGTGRTRASHSTDASIFPAKPATTAPTKESGTRTMSETNHTTAATQRLPRTDTIENESTHRKARPKKMRASNPAAFVAKYPSAMAQIPPAARSTPMQPVSKSARRQPPIRAHFTIQIASLIFHRTQPAGITETRRFAVFSLRAGLPHG